MSTTYENLNAEVAMLDADGKLQFHKDKEAARAYHLEYVNKHTRFFYSLHEKVNYLIENELWKRETVETFTFDQFKELFKQAYAHKFRFQSFMGARKFYSQYALMDLDGYTIIERFEDRVVMCAIDLSGGDYDQAKDLVDSIITGRFQPATPTFSNAGKVQGGERVSCFLYRVDDSTESINRAFNAASQLSRRGGGVGLNITNLREKGAPVRKTPGASKGVIPFMKVMEDTFKYFDQLGQRSGAGVVYLNAHHPDIMLACDSKRENADESIRIKTLSLGVIIPDITFELARDNKDMYLFSPYDIERVMGKPFSDVSVTENYWDWVEDDRITKTKINARTFFQTVSDLNFQSGYPYCLFEDEANRWHNLPNAGRVQMSNLCQYGDARLLTDRGYRKARDLYESQEDFNVIVDERARTMDLGNTGTSVQSSTRMFKTAENVPLYKISTEEGFENVATEWHKYYVCRNGEYVKIPLKDVELGDSLLIQSGEGAFGATHAPHEAYAAGVLASDGSISIRSEKWKSAVIDLFGDKKVFQEKIENTVESVIEHNFTGSARACRSPKFKDSQDAGIRLYSSALANSLESIGMDIVDRDAVPEFVFDGDSETVASYLSGRLAFDGCVSVPKKSPGSICFYMTSTNRQGLLDIQKLLLNFGIYSRVSTKDNKEGYHIQTDDKGAEVRWNHSKHYLLRVSGWQDFAGLEGIVDFKPSHLQNIERGRAGRKQVYRPRHNHMATVNSIEYYGVEDVYDVTVDNGNSVVFDGIVTGNCSEILQVQTPSTFNEDGSYKHVGEDISCNLGSLNIHHMLNLTNDEFTDTVISAVKALDQVSRTTSIDIVPTVKQGNDSTHSIGLGQMNLHGALGARRMWYDSDEARDLFDKYMAKVTWATMLASTQIAKVYGTHKYYDGSDYDNGKWFERVVAPKIEQFGDDLTIYGNLQAPTREEWEYLRVEMSKYGLSSGYFQAIPPTGSISYVNHSTSSIHPVAAALEIRKEQLTGRTYYPAPHLDNSNIEYFQSAAEIGPDATILMYERGQHWIDQGMSLTLFFPDTVTDKKTGQKRPVTTRDIDRARIFAWRHHIRTLYYIRVRQAALGGTEVAGTAMGLIGEIQEDACPSCAL